MKLSPLIGPLWEAELIRLIRRGRLHLARCGLLTALFALLVAAYSSHFPSRDLLTDLLGGSPGTLSHQALAVLSRDYVLFLLLGLTLAVHVFTPAYMASALTEEKEQGSLDLLLTTSLTDREIVLGKLVGRILPLFGLILTSVPLLCIVQLWGGISLWVIAAATGALLLSLLSVGALSMALSVASRGTLTALFGTYALTGVAALFCMATPLNGVATPITLVANLLDPFGGPIPPRVLLLLYAFVHLGLTAGACAFAVALLRPTSLGIGGWAEPRRPERPTPTPAPTFLAPPSRARKRRPVDEDRPLLWKELSDSDLDQQAREVEKLPWSLLAVGLVTASAAGLLLNSGPTVADVLGFIRSSARFLTLLLIAAWLVLTAFRASVGLRREQDHNTLDALRLLPDGMEGLFAAKAGGALLPGRILLYCLLPFWLLLLFSGQQHPLGLLALLISTAVYLGFLLAVGLWLSVVSRTTLWAQLGTALLVLLTLAGAWLVVANAEGAFRALQEADNDPWWRHLLRLGLNPLSALDRCSWSWADWVEGGQKGRVTLSVFLPWLLAGWAIYASLGGLLAWDARRRFQRWTLDER